jgi:hypothetical protein
VAVVDKAVAQGGRHECRFHAARDDSRPLSIGELGSDRVAWHLRASEV